MNYYRFVIVHSPSSCFSDLSSRDGFGWAMLNFSRLCENVQLYFWTHFFMFHPRRVSRLCCVLFSSVIRFLINLNFKFPFSKVSRTLVSRSVLSFITRNLIKEKIVWNADDNDEGDEENVTNLWTLDQWNLWSHFPLRTRRSSENHASQRKGGFYIIYFTVKSTCCCFFESKQNFNIINLFRPKWAAEKTQFEYNIWWLIQVNLNIICAYASCASAMQRERAKLLLVGMKNYARRWRHSSFLESRLLLTINAKISETVETTCCCVSSCKREFCRFPSRLFSRLVLLTPRRADRPLTTMIMLMTRRRQKTRK